MELSIRKRPLHIFSATVAWLTLSSTGLKDWGAEKQQCVEMPWFQTPKLSINLTKALENCTEPQHYWKIKHMLSFPNAPSFWLCRLARSSFSQTLSFWSIEDNSWLLRNTCGSILALETWAQLKERCILSHSSKDVSGTLLAFMHWDYFSLWQGPIKHATFFFFAII